MVHKIKKPTIIITSLGRTGTKFFQVMLGELLPGSFAVHEPDVFNYFQYQGLGNRLKEVYQQVRVAGFFNLLVKKPLGTWNITAISDARIKGEIDSTTALNRLIRQRAKFIFSQTGSLYIESSIGYYGILDLLNGAFESYRAVYLIRDGREWVRSNMNWGQMYGKSPLQGVFAHQWPTGDDLADVNRLDWQHMSRFEKLCWAWANLNNHALKAARKDQQVMVVRFEDIFQAEDRVINLRDLLSFLSEISGEIPGNNLDLEGWLSRQIHPGQGGFPAWENWSMDQRRIFEKHCGQLWADLGYSERIHTG